MQRGMTEPSELKKVRETGLLGATVHIYLGQRKYREPKRPEDLHLGGNLDLKHPVTPWVILDLFSMRTEKRGSPVVNVNRQLQRLVKLFGIAV